MKLFKIDEYKLYEKYFENMTVSEFFALDTVPKNVEETHMRSLTGFLQAEKNHFVRSGVGSKSEMSDQELGAVFESMTIGNVIIRKLIESGEIDIEEILREVI